MASVAIEWRTVKAAKRHNPQNPISAAFMAIEQAIEFSDFHQLTSVEDADVVFVFGSITPRKMDVERAIAIQALRDQGKHIFSIDSGLFGTYMRMKMNTNENMFFRIGYKDCTGEGDLLMKDMPRTRLDWMTQEFNFEVKEPKENTPGILFIGQSEKGWQYDLTEPYEEWALKQLLEIRRQTEEPIIFRVHPTDVSNVRQVVGAVRNVHVTAGSRSRVGIIEDLQKVGTVVTHSSSAALEALVEGCKVVALSDRCVVQDACCHFFEEKMRWKHTAQRLKDYAYTTWHVQELTNPKLLEYYLSFIK